MSMNKLMSIFLCSLCLHLHVSYILRITAPQKGRHMYCTPSGFMFSLQIGKLKGRIFFFYFWERDLILHIWIGFNVEFLPPGLFMSLYDSLFSMKSQAAFHWVAFDGNCQKTRTRASYRSIVLWRRSGRISDKRKSRPSLMLLISKCRFPAKVMSSMWIFLCGV